MYGGRKHYYKIDCEVFFMGIFGNKEDKAQKDLAKLQEIAAKYNLTDVNPKDLETIRNINYGLMGSGLMEFGTLLTGKTEDNVKISYLSALVQQNWIIIRQLDEISKKLDK